MQRICRKGGACLRAMQRICRKGRSPLAGDSARSHRLQAGSSKSRESPLESEPAQSSFRSHGSGDPSHMSAPTGRETRATSDPRGNGCTRAQNAGGAAWAARITGAVRSPQTPTPAPSGCLDSVRLPRPDPVRGIKRDGAVMFLRSPALQPPAIISAMTSFWKISSLVGADMG